MLENHRFRCVSYEITKIVWMRLHGLHSQRCTCVQWGMTARLTFGICRQICTKTWSRLHYWSIRRMSRSPTWLGRYYRRNGWQFVLWNSFKFSDYDLWYIFIPNFIVKVYVVLLSIIFLFYFPLSIKESCFNLYMCFMIWMHFWLLNLDYRFRKVWALLNGLNSSGSVNKS
jgi:hypothetical protein